MVRPRLSRRIRFDPEVTYYKPRGVPFRELEEEVLKMDEVEALRLCDVKELKQEEAAKKMNISQPTLYRLLNTARKKIASAIITGKAIRIENGE